MEPSTWTIYHNKNTLVLDAFKEHVKFYSIRVWAFY